MKQATRPLIRKAEADWNDAQTLFEKGGRSHDGVYFHCQQSAEKYLKAILEEVGAYIPKTHNLDDLLQLVQAHVPSLSPWRRGLIFLTRFAVETRYPGKNTTKRQALSALRWAGRIRSEVRTLLGLH